MQSHYEYSVVRTAEGAAGQLEADLQRRVRNGQPRRGLGLRLRLLLVRVMQNVLATLTAGGTRSAPSSEARSQQTPQNIVSLINLGHDHAMVANR